MGREYTNRECVMPIQQVFSHYERGGPPPGGFSYCPFCRTALIVAQEENRPRPSCPQCGFVQHRNPAPTVSIAIVEGDQVLLGKRGANPGRGTWALPSGYVDYEEDFLTAARREAREETGLEVEISSLINVISSFVSPRFHFLGLYVAARVVGGDVDERLRFIVTAGSDLEEVAWFPIAGPLPEMGFEEDAAIIELVAQGHAGLPVDPNWAHRGI